jgi:hypothetical protein
MVSPPCGAVFGPVDVIVGESALGVDLGHLGSGGLGGRGEGGAKWLTRLEACTVQLKIENLAKRNFRLPTVIHWTLIKVMHR